MRTKKGKHVFCVYACDAPVMCLVLALVVHKGCWRHQTYQYCSSFQADSFTGQLVKTPYHAVLCHVMVFCDLSLGVRMAHENGNTERQHFRRKAAEKRKEAFR